MLTIFLHIFTGILDYLSSKFLRFECLIAINLIFSFIQRLLSDLKVWPWLGCSELVIPHPIRRNRLMKLKDYFENLNCHLDLAALSIIMMEGDDIKISFSILFKEQDSLAVIYFV